MVIQRVRYGNHTRVESLISRFIPANQQNGLSEWVKCEKDSERADHHIFPIFRSTPMQNAKNKDLTPNLSTASGNQFGGCL